MEVYKAATREILRRYRAGEITRARCIAALDAAVADLLAKMAPEDLDEFQSAMLVTADALRETITKRCLKRKTMEASAGSSV